MLHLPARFLESKPVTWLGAVQALAATAIFVASLVGGLVTVLLDFPTGWAVLTAASAFVLAMNLLLFGRRFVRIKTGAELRNSTYIKNRTFRIADLVPEDGPPILRDRTFEDCTIVGPAIIAPQGSPVIKDFLFDGVDGRDLEGVLWHPSPGHPVVGVIVLVNPVMRRCTLRHIGIAGTPSDLAQWRGVFSNNMERHVGAPPWKRKA